MTKDEIIRMAREAGIADGMELDREIAEFERFAKLVAAAEREACAVQLDEMAEKDKLTNYYKVAANAIRARGQG
jgi:hypothetical protein